MSKPDFKLSVPIVPESKARPRFTTHGHVYTPTKTKEYEFAIRDRWTRTYGKLAPSREPIRLSILFVMPRPKAMTWKRKPMTRCPCDKRPDLDNLTKAVTDALNGFAYVDDGLIWNQSTTKVYAAGNEGPHIEIAIWEGSPITKFFEGPLWEDGDDG